MTEAHGAPPRTLARHLAWTALLLLAAGHQVYFAFRVDRLNPVPEYDEAVYADLAREWARSGAPLRRMGPQPSFYYIHPYLQTALWSIPVRLDNSSESPQSSSKALALLRVMRWLTTLLAFSALAALLGFPGRISMTWGITILVLLGWNPLWLKYSHLVYLEAPAALWALLSILTLNRAISQTRGSLTALSGAFCGLAVITKYIALPWALAAMTFLLGRSVRGGRGYQPLWVWMAAFGAVFSSWPLLILIKGSPSDWLARSLGRWGSFQAGQGGDPRTDWGILRLIWETVREMGPVHALLLALGFLFLLLGRIGGQGRLRGLRLHAIFLSVFVLFWLASPTRDPKFLVVALPSFCLVAAIGWVAILGMLWEKARSVRLGLPLVSLVGALALLAAFPVDVLGLDQGPLRKLYPTDHAYTRICLPHGVDYPPLVDALGAMEGSDQPILVGRQGPIVGYLADRAYSLLYVRREESEVARLLDSRAHLVLDDTWENCLAGLSEQGRLRMRERIMEEYKEVWRSGRVRLLNPI